MHIVSKVGARYYLGDGDYDDFGGGIDSCARREHHRQYHGGCPVNEHYRRQYEFAVDDHTSFGLRWP